MVRMAVIPYTERSVVGPVSKTHYKFNPWAQVEERDVEQMQTITVQKGCACNGNAKVLPLFATEEQVMSRKVVPEWAGRFGSPQRV